MFTKIINKKIITVSLCLISLLLINQKISAQSLIWAKCFIDSSSLADVGTSIAVDKQGNVYSTGYFYAADFDPGLPQLYLMTNGAYDTYISKLDRFGNFVWVKTFGGTNDDKGSSIALDNLGNIYVTGSFRGTSDFDPGPGVYNLTSSGQVDVFILKLDASGNFSWAKRIGSNDYDEPFGITVDNSGNVCCTGSFRNTVDFDPNSGVSNLTSSGGDDIFILKLSSSGNLVWADKMGGTLTQQGFAIVSDSFDNVYVTGFFEGTTDFDPGAGVANLTASDQDVFILKVNSSGSYVWAKKVGGLNFEQGNSIAVDALANVYVTGTFSGVIDFDPGASTYNLTSNSGSIDAFCLKLNSSGNFNWAINFGGQLTDVGYSIALDTLSNVFISGYFMDVADFNPGAGTYNLTAAGLEDIYILKLNPTGTFSRAMRIGGGKADHGKSIARDMSGNICITGLYFGIVDFDPEIGTSYLGVVPFPSGFDPDIYISKYCFPPDSVGVISGSISVCKESTSTYSILPVRGATGYKWTVPIDAIITAGQNSTTISVKFGSTSGDISVTPTNFCDGVSKSISVLVRSKPTIGCIVSPSLSVCPGTAITLNGTGGISYSWSGGITNGNAFTPLTTTTYNVIGVDIYGCSNTSSITIIVIPLPTFSIQPSNYNVIIGNTAFFTAKSTNSTCTYQWQQDTGTGFINLSNAGQYSGSTSETLTISATKLSQNNYLYRCIIKDGSCSNSSISAKLIVTTNCNLNITLQPSNQLAKVGDNIQLKTNSSGINAIYQWQQNLGVGFTNLSNTGQFSGVATNILTISNLTLTQNNTLFRCIVKEGVCSDTSKSALLEVCDLSILTQPKSQIKKIGTTAMFTCIAANSNVNYQWEMDEGVGFVKLINSSLYSGVTEDTLFVKNITYFQNNNLFRCVITDGICNDTSKYTVLKVCESVFTNQLLNQNAMVGDTILFLVESSSPFALYQWQEDSGSGFVNMVNSPNYDGTTNDTLKIVSAIITQNNYRYRCILMDGICFDTSNMAILYVSKSTTGMQNLMSENHFVIYPNPVGNFINISSEVVMEESNYSIFDGMGRIVLSGTFSSPISTIDIHTLAPGFYFVMIGDDRKEIFKLIKK